MHVSWVRAVVLLLGMGLSGVAHAAGPAACETRYPFGYGRPSTQGISSDVLLDLTRWIKNFDAPVFSLLISRNGKIVYSLLTSHIDPEAAHYLMSVTKSVTSALVGVAVDRGLLRGGGQTLAEALPAPWASQVARGPLARLTIKDVLGMSALDAPVAPHDMSQAARDRNFRFLNAANRFAFALEQKPLPRPGSDFLYTDVTPLLAGGVVQLAARQSLLDFAQSSLFGPMGFRNADWMHQDAAGYDDASYGLRLRPVDMQKFGILFLNDGCWDGQPLLSQAWVRLSLTPWIASSPGGHLNYGWYWWRSVFAHGWSAATANGWKGQRIAVFRNQGIVVTMTALAENGTEDELFRTIINRFVIPALTEHSTSNPEQELRAALDDVWRHTMRIPAGAQARMIPSIAAKEVHRTFHPEKAP